MEKVKVYTLEPANGQKSFYGKAYVIYTEEGVYLQSYNTVMAKIDNHGKVHKLSAFRSNTTFKHIKAFFETYSIDEYSAKFWNELPLETA